MRITDEVFNLSNFKIVIMNHDSGFMNYNSGS